MSNSDYYKILSVSHDASAEEIKRAYRKLALETHPDRNPGNVTAEERFKKINEAYGVLSDSAKRSQYDQYRHVGSQPGTGPGMGFGYSQDDIFKDFFRGGHTQDIFREMEKEFSRMGIRFDPAFINTFFFGGRNVSVQNFFFGPGKVRVVRFGRPPTMRQNGFRTDAHSKPEILKSGKSLFPGLSLLGKAGKAAGGYFLRKVFGVERSRRQVEGRRGTTSGPNLTYSLNITTAQAQFGDTVQVNLPHQGGGKLISVRIPPGVRTGTRLRLKDIGNMLPGQNDRVADLYIVLKVNSLP